MNLRLASELHCYRLPVLRLLFAGVACLASLILLFRVLITITVSIATAITRMIILAAFLVGTGVVVRWIRFVDSGYVGCVF